MPDPIANLLADLQRHGIFIIFNGLHLRVFPQHLLTPELTEQIATYESELIAHLNSEADESSNSDDGDSGTTCWTDRVDRLVETSRPSMSEQDCEQLFYETAEILDSGGDQNLADAEMRIFGHLLFRILQLGIDVRAT